MARTGFSLAWLRAALERRAAYAAQAVALGERLRSRGGPAAAIEAIVEWH